MIPKLLSLKLCTDGPSSKSALTMITKALDHVLMK